MKKLWEKKKANVSSAKEVRSHPSVGITKTKKKHLLHHVPNLSLPVWPVPQATNNIKINSYPY